MTYTVSGETLNPTHSLTHCYCYCWPQWWVVICKNMPGLLSVLGLVGVYIFHLSSPSLGDYLQDIFLLGILA